MLNQTLPHFFFQLNPSSSSSPLLSSSAAPPPLSPLSSSYSKLKTQGEMECVEEINALKNSFWSEMTMKSNNPQVICEDFWGVNGGNGVVSGDDLFVEGLLDFSNEDVDVGFVEDEEEEKESISASSSSPSSSSSQQEEKYYSCAELSVKAEPLSVTNSELGVPADDLADLEWLSHFVEDSFSEFSLQHVAGTQPEKTKTPKQSWRCEARPIDFLTSFPAKARSKRSRTGGRVWSLGLLPSSESSSSSSSSSPVSPSSSSSCLINNSTGENLDALNYVGEPAAAAKRQKKKAATELQQRRCSHCGVQKTPQWRTGPKGAKTLCNACGVRYKSGRLLPEYRPACSPTFSSEVHSNNHRKVLEMRRKKEMGLRELGGCGGAGLASPVQSF